MSAEEWETNVSGRGAGSEAKVQGGRMISWEREHHDTRREEQESQSLVNHHRSLLSHSLYSTVFHLKLLLFVKKKNTKILSSIAFKATLSLCAPPFTSSPPPSSPWSCLLTPSLSPSLPHVQRHDHGVRSPPLSLCHIYSLRLTLCSVRQSPASFYFSVSSWQQHHIIPLNPRANMPPHLNRLRRMRAATALQTHFLQSILFQLVFFTPINTLLHTQFLCKL